ncbi:MMPL family transporter [Demequina sp. NBRC 110053]|uniref:MMPL family transporter n=1 Tax=Demequina sp. NBRC 110053 TaxID=1570342 RepID=UPI000A05F2FE|nr:MMPL family transporter [Demequina sp. NBRC 110053]
MLDRLGAFVAKAPRAVVFVWAVVAVLGAVFGGAVFDQTSDVDGAPRGTESMEVEARLAELDPEGEIVTAVLTGQDFFSLELTEAAPAVMERLRKLPGVVEVTDAYTSGGLIGDDARSSLVSIELDPSLSEEEALATADEVGTLLRDLPVPEVLIGGELVSQEAFVQRAIQDTATGEAVAVVILLILLVTILGGFRVGALPVLTALVAICGSLLVLRGVMTAVAVNEFAVNVVTILGLGLAVDYSLLVIWRFREEREATPASAPRDLVARAAARAGRAVLVSGLAVCIALAGMLVLGDPLLSGMAAGGAVAVLVATATGLTFVPAMILLMHRHVPPRGVRTWCRPWVRPTSAQRVTLLARLTRASQARPGLIASATTVVLVLVAAPVASLTLGGSDVQSLPSGSPERRAYEAITTGFQDLGVEPIVVVVEAPVSEPQTTALLDGIYDLEGVDDARAVPDLPTGVTVAEFTPVGTSTGAAAQALVREIRAMETPLDMTVGGPAAEVVDSRDHLAERLPFALALVVLSTLALLFALTRSVVVPVKALLLNALTIAATLGVLVAIFQWGWAASALGVEPWGALDVTTPLFIGLLAFGLSMDYEVFLLSRIHEAWRQRDRAMDPREANRVAVMRGITATGPVVTTAAIAISLVFLGFALSSLTAMKEVGIGMVVAIAIDVTLIRGLLLPATMTLLGQWNWWPGPRTRGVPQNESRSPSMSNV